MKASDFTDKRVRKIVKQAQEDRPVRSPGEVISGVEQSLADTAEGAVESLMGDEAEYASKPSTFGGYLRRYKEQKGELPSPEKIMQAAQALGSADESEDKIKQQAMQALEGLNELQAKVKNKLSPEKQKEPAGPWGKIKDTAQGAGQAVQDYVSEHPEELATGSGAALGAGIGGSQAGLAGGLAGTALGAGAGYGAQEAYEHRDKIQQALNNLLNNNQSA